MSAVHARSADSSPQATSPSPAGVRAGPLQEVSASQVQQWIRDGCACLVDVREPDEHARERIAGATLVPLSQFDASRVGSLAAGKARVVFHCKGGKRSAEAARLADALRASGCEVLSMAGGIEAWKGQGLPTVLDARVSRISVMRQVQMVVGAGVLLGSVLAWLVHPAWIALPAFFGAGLLFAGATGTCALASVLGKMPWNKAPQAGAACALGGN